MIKSIDEKQIEELKKRHNIDEDDHSYDEQLKQSLLNGGKITPGMIYAVSEPEYIGAMPVRTELEVLPKNIAPSKGWTFGSSYEGYEIYKIDSFGKIDRKPLIRRKDIKVGSMILAITLVGEIKANVIKYEGELCALSESGKTLIVLDFNKDDRYCWTSSMAVNTKLLEKIT
jgi:hypothetical protein